MRRVLAAAAALLLLAGCSCGGPTGPCGRAPAPAPEAPTAEAPFFFGQQVELELEVSADGVCQNDTPPEVNQVTVEVSDPRNLPVEHYATPPKRYELPRGGAVWRSRVAFNPTRPGSHHVLVAFEPAGGLAQRDVQVVVDRRGAPARTAGTPGVDCDAVVFTARGSTVCRLAGGGAKLFRANAEVVTWSGAIQVSGDALWEMSTQGFASRALDLGSGPPAITHLGSFIGTGQYAFTPLDDQVVWWNSRAAERLVAADGGTLERLSRTDVAEDRYPKALAFAADAGLALFGDEVKWGRIPLLPGNTTVVPGWHEVDALVAHQPDCLWVKVGVAVQRVAADPRVAEPVFVPPQGWELRSDFALVGNYDTQPVFFPQGLAGMDFTRALVPVADGADAYLAYYEALAGTEFVGVSGGLLHARKEAEHYFWPVGP